MAGYLKGGIILMPFPFSGEDGFKVRPALVLADLPYGSDTDYLVCIISTQAAPDPTLLELDNRDVIGGSLSQKCYLRPAYTYAVAGHRVIRRLGQIKPEKLNAVTSALVALLTK